MKISVHPLAEKFPHMSDSEVKELRQSIKADGLEFPIVVHKNQIVDGRHRYEACLAENVKPWVVQYDGDDTPEALARYVYRANAMRRHLTTSQRAMFRAEMASLSEGNPQLATPQICGVSAAAAAETVGVSTRSVETAAKVLKNADPVIVHAVEAGTISVSDAATVATLPKKEQKAALKKVESGKATTLKAAAKKEPHERNGQQVKDPREFERLKQDIGRLAPRFDRLNEQAPGPKFKRDAQAKVNELLHVLEDWRKATR